MIYSKIYISLVLVFDLKDIGNLVFLTPEYEQDTSYARTSYGAVARLTTVVNDPNILEIGYPVKQILPMVYVTTGATATEDIPVPEPIETAETGSVLSQIMG